MKYTQYSPQKIFENDKDGVIEVKNKPLSLTAGLNQTAIAAVTGKKLYVVGLEAFTTTGTFNLKDGASGSILWYGPTATWTSLILPVTELGYGISTSTSTALGIDTFTANININIHYIEITS